MRDGLGVAVLPDWLIKDELASGDLMPVLPKWKAKDLPIHVVYAGQRVLLTRLSAFIDFAVCYLLRRDEVFNARLVGLLGLEPRTPAL